MTKQGDRGPQKSSGFLTDQQQEHHQHESWPSLKLSIGVIRAHDSTASVLSAIEHLISNPSSPPRKFLKWAGARNIRCNCRDGCMVIEIVPSSATDVTKMYRLYRNRQLQEGFKKKLWHPITPLEHDFDIELDLSDIAQVYATLLKRTIVFPDATHEERFENAVREVCYHPLEETPRKLPMSVPFRTIKRDIGYLGNATNKYGETLLHVVVMKGTILALRVLFFTGIFGRLLNIPVQEGFGSAHPRYTARSIAETIAHGSGDNVLLLEFDELFAWERSMSPLDKACRLGDFKQVQNFLKGREGETRQIQPEISGSNCMYWACVAGNLDILSLLVERGLDTNAVNLRRESLLSVACKFGHGHLITRLLGRYNLDANHVDASGMTPLGYLAANGDEELLCNALKNGPAPSCLATLLFIAAEYSQCSMIRYLVDRCGVDMSTRDEHGNTLLHIAVRTGSRTLISYLLEERLNLRATNNQGRTALHIAVICRREGAVELLLASAKRTKILPSVINPTDSYDQIRILLQGNVDHHGMMPVWCTLECNREMVAVLQKKAANNNLVNAMDCGQLIWCRRGRFPEGQKLMCPPPNGDGCTPHNTPLHYSVCQEDVKVTRLLLKSGADPTLRNHFGDTAHAIARRSNNENILHLLREGGDIEHFDDADVVVAPKEQAEHEENEDERGINDAVPAASRQFADEDSREVGYDYDPLPPRTLREDSPVHESEVVVGVERGAAAAVAESHATNNNQGPSNCLNIMMPDTDLQPSRDSGPVENINISAPIEFHLQNIRILYDAAQGIYNHTERERS